MMVSGSLSASHWYRREDPVGFLNATTYPFQESELPNRCARWQILRAEPVHLTFPNSL
ncbi:MAG: hypothetical protein PWP44_1650 [Thermacetogenium sp.]|jgi:hypothetical protein|uniref:Uncharacterized protein n=1 Tax=Thermacetogenium phaeum TaxID=85874 RepID=A0A101FFJ4_9THEO|nr:MAG: hypothetical protein XD66_1197 [Thermacetogenium phaeum]MDN5366444.1 hypothetical protein [Thermacetogenium sp.]